MPSRHSGRSPAPRTGRSCTAWRGSRSCSCSTARAGSARPSSWRPRCMRPRRRPTTWKDSCSASATSARWSSAAGRRSVRGAIRWRAWRSWLRCPVPERRSSSRCSTAIPPSPASASTRASSAWVPRWSPPDCGPAASACCSLPLPPPSAGSTWIRSHACAGPGPRGASTRPCAPGSGSRRWLASCRAHAASTWSATRATWRSACSSPSSTPGTTAGCRALVRSGR